MYSVISLTNFVQILTRIFTFTADNYRLTTAVIFFTAIDF